MKFTKQLFTEKQENNLAASLVWGLQAARVAQGAKYKRGDIILVNADIAALDLAKKIHARLLDLKLNPVIKILSPYQFDFDYFNISNKQQINFIAPGMKKFYNNLNGVISLRAPESITHLKNIKDPKKISQREVVMKFAKNAVFGREARGLLGSTLTYLPTEATAREAGLSVKSFTEQIVKACFLDAKNSVEKWENLKYEADVIKKWLNIVTKNTLYFHVESKNVNLKVTPGNKRQWLGVSGHNIPSFENFISPDWRGTEGIFYADQKSYRNGNLVEGVKLEFKRGSTIKISAKKGAKFVESQLSMDRGANKLGEFSLTDIRFSNIDKFTANTLYDENFGGKHGNCHIAVGSSYPDTYSGKTSNLTEGMQKKLGFNDSALHWDLVNSEKKTVTAHLKDGKKLVIYEDGMYKY